VFNGAAFGQGAKFQHTYFCNEVDFHWTTFERPELILFRQVNKPGLHCRKVEPPEGLRASFLNSRVEHVRFEGVNWYRQKGRMVLQDELDSGGQVMAYELVATTYRQLVSNFEAARAYHDAEDCKIGAMEMERLDHHQPLLRRLAATVYKWASVYGSSYERALTVLLALLLGFGFLFALPSVSIQYVSKQGSHPVPPGWRRVAAGISHSLDVATFQRVDPHEFEGFFWRPLTLTESIVVPSQLALFLLALRRRFRT
jgi:hypothetical protein